MHYKIEGEPLPVLVLNLEAGESVYTESGAMSWMTPSMHMETDSRGGAGKVFGRMFSGESLFLNTYTAVGANGMIAFASCFPGSIRPIEISAGKEIIAQKSAFLCATPGVDLSIHFQRKLGAGFFGGEGFIMQRLSGHGLAFLEIDGHAMEYTLAPGQQMILDTGYLAAMEATCTMDIVTVKGIKNVLFGGEGLFNTLVTGPGRIWIQSAPISKLAGLIGSKIVTKG